MTPWLPFLYRVTPSQFARRLHCPGFFSLGGFLIGLTESASLIVTRVGPQHRRGDVLNLRHTKNDSEAFIPITLELRAAIEAMGSARHLTYLHTRAGAPRSPKALGGDFRSWCDAAGIGIRCPKKTEHRPMGPVCKSRGLIWRR
jgi:hypothetical protein